MKRILLLLVGLALLIFPLAACKSASNTGSATQNPTVTMDASTFQNTTITISKGQTITFTDDATTGTPHILVIGKDGSPNDETGAPDFDAPTGQSFQPGDSWTSPPWNTAGTYYVTCTIHPTTMTLTVVVTG